MGYMLVTAYFLTMKAPEEVKLLLLGKYPGLANIALGLDNCQGWEISMLFVIGDTLRIMSKCSG